MTISDLINERTTLIIECDRLRSENTELRRTVDSLADRVHLQGELLSRVAEGKPPRIAVLTDAERASYHSE